MLYCMAQNPVAQNSLYLEVLSNISQNGIVTAECLQNVPYAKACLKETLRFEHIHNFLEFMFALYLINILKMTYAINVICTLVKMT